MAKARTSAPSPLPSRRLWTSFALSLLGVGFSIYLTQHFYLVREGASAFKSFCNMGGGMNCDQVAASRWAEVFAGLPLSSFTTGWYGAIAILALAARSPAWRREAARWLLALSAFASVMSVVYFAVMASVLRTYCLFCLFIDAINLLLLGIAWSLRPEGFAKHKPDLQKWRVFGGVTAGSLVVFVGGLALANVDLSMSPATVEDMVQSIVTAPPIAVKSGEQFPSIGPADAPITVVEFSDFQCPHCERGAHILNTVLNRFPGKVRVVFRNFPLDPSCNPNMKQSLHQAACEAARAAICAHQQGRFQEVYEAFFSDLSVLAPGKVTAIAESFVPDVPKLKACMEAPETAAAVRADIDEALAVGVQSTPTFFINGRRMHGAFPVAAWIQIIERVFPPAAPPK